MYQGRDFGVGTLKYISVFFLSLAKIQILYYIGNQFVIKFLFFLRQSLVYPGFDYRNPCHFQPFSQPLFEFAVDSIPTVAK